MPSPLTYATAGVSIDAGYRLVQRIKPLAKKTLIPGVLAGIGGFGALFEVPAGYRQPVLVTGTDGVGTKLKLAFALNRHDTVGQDLVAMSVNDILVSGARPLYFLDYYVCERLDVDVAARVIGGIARGCEIAGCALIGGETAEHPQAFPENEYDLAGFAVGIVEKDAIIDGSTIALDDAVLGLASSGVHSNGFSLIRRILDRSGARFEEDVGGRSLGDVLLAPTRIYCKPVLDVMTRVKLKGLAHITGGGLLENVPRVLPENSQARLDRQTWPRPPIFDWLQQRGGIADDEMFRVFNCGIGMAIVVGAADAERTIAAFAAAGESCYRIGEIVPRANGASGCVVV